MRDVGRSVLLCLALGGAAWADDPAPRPQGSRAPAVGKPDPVTAPPIGVGVGVAKEITLAGVRRVSLSDSSVLSATVLEGGKVRLVGLADGPTILTAWSSDSEHTDYLITVRHDAGVNELVRGVRRLLGDVDGVLVRQVGNRIVLDGETYSQDDADHVARVAVNAPFPVVNLTRLASTSRRLVLAAAQEALVKAGFVDTTLVLTGSTFILTGSLGSPADRARAEAIVRDLLAR